MNALALSGIYGLATTQREGRGHEREFDVPSATLYHYVIAPRWGATGLNLTFDRSIPSFLALEFFAAGFPGSFSYNLKST